MARHDQVQPESPLQPADSDRHAVARAPWRSISGSAGLFDFFTLLLCARFEHRGVDWRAVAHLIWAGLRGRRVIGGASTITQQLARNLYLTPARTVRRKSREARIALALERQLSKARILELYLNVVEFGSAVWGCTAGSASYFGKSPLDLDVFESTFLVSLIPAPKAPLTGCNAARSRAAHMLLAYRLFLSGLCDGRECARCCHRIWELHRLLAVGLQLPDALEGSARVAAGDDARLFEELAASLQLSPLTAADLLASRCGQAQQDRATSALRARFGDDVLLQVLRTSSHAPLAAISRG